MEYQQPYVQYDPRDVQQTKSIAWLSYLGILFLIPMFVYKELRTQSSTSIRALCCAFWMWPAVLCLAL